MAIDNSRDLIVEWGLTDHLYFGANRLVAPGSYVLDWDNGVLDTVTFAGTAGRDTLIGGGGEYASFFLGGAGNDLYGVDGSTLDWFPLGYVDYSGARSGVIVDLTLKGGSRSFTDETGAARTVAILGMALKDGFGGIDSFAENPERPGSSSVYGIFGSRFGDVLVGANASDLYGGGGGDTLVGGSLSGGAGADRLFLVSGGDYSTYAAGDDGNDFIFGSDFADLLDGGAGDDFVRGGDGADRIGGGDGDDTLDGGDGADGRLAGGAGDDRILAGGGNDGYVVGEAGNDYVDGGAGNDFIDGGVGRDILVSGAGSDTINPDVEFFQTAPNQARDGARDVIAVTRADVGDFDDVVLSRAFEEGRDQVQFRDAAAGRDFRVHHEAQSFNPATGGLFRSDDLADQRNTVLQIDADRDGFGKGSADGDDYFLVVLDADLSFQRGWLLA